MTAQESNQEMANIYKSLGAYGKIWTPEKIYVHTDKKVYSPGETIWAKAYILDGITHKKGTNSNIFYFEILGPNRNIISKKRVFRYEFGAEISFDIPRDIAVGTYTIRACSKYMLNDLEPFYFEQQLVIGNSGIANVDETTQSSDLQVSVHAEGGNLVYGIKGTIGIKITDRFGNPVSTKGEIIDGDDEVITSFDTGDYGLGKCTFIPREGNTYFVGTKSDSEGRKYPLPTIHDMGYTLQIENLGPQLIISAKTNQPNGLKGTVLVGHMRGERFLWFRATQMHNSEYNIRIPLDPLNDGIAHFTLFSEKGEPLCERLVHVENTGNAPKLNFMSQKPSENGEVDLQFTLSGSDGAYTAGDFSISVWENNEGSKKNDFDPNIKDWLTIHSDLGYEPLAFEILAETHPIKRRKTLDVLLLCSSWKRFSWKNWVHERPIDSYIAPEKGIVLNGTVTATSNTSQLVPAMVSLNILGADVYQTQERTDSEGRFKFGPFDFTDSLTIVLKASKLNARNKSERRKVLLELEEDGPFEFPAKLAKNVTLGTEGEVAKEIVSGIKPKRYASGDYDFEIGKDITKLEEVVVTEKKLTQKELIAEQIKKITLYNRPSFRVFADSLPYTGIRNVLDLFRTLPGVQVKGPIGGETVRIRYGVNSILLPTEPIYLIDGVQVPLDAIKFMNSLDVMFIDVLKGADASIYGVRGANGAIAVYTRRGTGLDYAGGQGDIGNGNRASPHMLTFTQPGFDRARSFEVVPCPTTETIGGNKTVFWEPNVRIIGAKHKTLRFCAGTSDAKSYHIRVEGITEDGKAISEIFTLNLD
ncbi:MG2 domain-containing protein [Flagellimonas sp.]|uniref:MG2 domain-containing protein n=1 Tax=Flagellimonas sp. TaxID=2058762 RepID=UPI003F49CFAE